VFIEDVAVLQGRPLTQARLEAMQALHGFTNRLGFEDGSGLCGAVVLLLAWVGSVCRGSAGRCCAGMGSGAKWAVTPVA